MGIPKAKVFPVPVLARPIMSRPCMAGSSTALCITDKHQALTSILDYITVVFRLSMQKRQPPKILKDHPSQNPIHPSGIRQDTGNTPLDNIPTIVSWKNLMEEKIIIKRPNCKQLIKTEVSSKNLKNIVFKKKNDLEREVQPMANPKLPKQTVPLIKTITADDNIQNTKKCPIYKFQLFQIVDPKSPVG